MRENKITRRGFLRNLVLTVLFCSAIGGLGFAQTTLPAAEVSYRPPIMAKNYIVETNNPLATMSAIDAAVAVAASLSVAEPYLSNIFGGDAFIMIYTAKDKKVQVVNASGWAPTGATQEYFMAKGGMVGGIDSFEIPGAFSGWAQALNKFGTMPLSQVFKPAIDLCENGIAVSPFFTQQVVGGIKKFNKEAMNVFAPGGKAPAVGTIIYQPNLANTFRELGNAGYLGEEVFYSKYGEKIAALSKSLGGLHTPADFAEFRAEIVDPLHTNYEGIDVYACPPGCQGMVLIQALNILEPYDIKALGHNTAAYINLLTEALNLGFADRDKYIGDPRFVDIPIKGLTSKEYAAEQRKRITLGSTNKVVNNTTAGEPSAYDNGNTTFFSIVDKDRNVVACTTSILDGWGCGIMAGDTGIMLNNRMNYFWLDEDHPNVVAPRKRTFQTITPSIALKDGKPIYTFGTPGADVQEQTKLQIFFNALYFGMNPQRAIEVPRFRTDAFPAASYPHNAFNGQLRLESRIPASVQKELGAMGYDVQLFPDWTTGMGGAGMIYIDPKTNFMQGGVDPRREGYVIGW
jgi:gamma-glutamyltranspeptidase/glutathione hydrolase